MRYVLNFMLSKTPIQIQSEHAPRWYTNNGSNLLIHFADGSECDNLKHSFGPRSWHVVGQGEDAYVPIGTESTEDVEVNTIPPRISRATFDADLVIPQTIHTPNTTVYTSNAQGIVIGNNSTQTNHFL